MTCHFSLGVDMRNYFYAEYWCFEYELDNGYDNINE